MPECSRGLRSRSGERPVTNDKDGDAEGQDSAHDKWRNTDIDTEGESVEPLTGQEPRTGHAMKFAAAPKSLA